MSTEVRYPHFVPDDEIREDVLRHRLHDYFGPRARIGERTDSGPRGQTGWLIDGGRVTDRILRDLKHDTRTVNEALALEADRNARNARDAARTARGPPQTSRSSQESRHPLLNDMHHVPDVPGYSPRSSSHLPPDDEAPFSLTGARHRTYAADSIAQRKAPSPPFTDPANAAKHPERNFTLQDFEDFRTFQEYVRLRKGRLENDTTRRHRDDTYGSPPSYQPESIAAYPGRHQSLTGSGRRNKDDDDPDAPAPYVYRPSPSRHGRHNDDDDPGYGQRPPTPRYGRHNDDDDPHDGPIGDGRPIARYSRDDDNDDAFPSVYSNDRGFPRSSTLQQRNLINPFKRKGKLLDLPMFLGNDVKKIVKVNVIPDTGATVNVISRKFLEDTDAEAIVRLSEDRNPRSSSLNMADGSTISTLGQLTIPCSFPDTPDKVMQVVFHVCETLAENIRVLVGKQFLETTKTLTVFAHRMIERPVDLRAIPRVMRLATQKSNSRSRLSILIDSKPYLACPDTGSEIDIFSAAFAKLIKVQVQALASSDPAEIQYANGRRQKVLGKAVVDVSIAKDTSNSHFEKHFSSISITDDEDSESDLFGSPGTLRHQSILTQNRGSRVVLSRQRTFYLVQGLASNIILGQAFLYSIDAYNTYKYAFVESAAPDGSDTLNGIFVTKRSGRQGTAPTTPTTKTELNSALNKIDQQYIADKRKLDKNIEDATDSYTIRQLGAKREELKQKHDLDSQRIKKQYKDAIAKVKKPKR